MVEFQRRFEQLMERRLNGKLLDEESGQWNHVTARTRQRKRPPSEGEIELKNRFAELQNEEWA